MTQQKHFFASIQVLRGMAALAVVLMHVSEMLLQYTDGHGIFCRIASFWHIGAAGVDLFFVISGFVMVESTRNMFQTKGASRTFLIRRLIRIVPLYWLYTTLMLLLVLLPFTLKESVFSFIYTLKSYLFVPACNPATGLALPLVPQGWTLSLEMYFYLLFALLLQFERRWLLPSLTLFFAASAIAGLCIDFHDPVLKAITSPLLLEFALGCQIARLVNQIKIPPFICYCCMAAGGVLLFLTHSFPEAAQYRLLVWGTPAFLFTLGLVFLEKELSLKFPGICIRLGDASYSLYLSHVFVLLAIGTLLKRKAIPSYIPNDFIAFFSVTACVAAAWFSYVLIETKSSQYLRNKML
jgi:hypothetical protein